MSMESEGATSNIELGSVLACEGDLPLHETANFKAEPTSPKASADQERETRLEAIAAEIESVLGTAIMRVAALVAEAHELHRYQHGDGGFEGWVERRLKMSRRTAYTFSMREMPRPAWRCGPCRSSGLHPCSVYFTEVSLELGHAPSPFQCRPTVGAHRQ